MNKLFYLQLNITFVKLIPAQEFQKQENMHSLARIPDISKQIVDELDSDSKEFAGVQMALAAYERKWLLQRMTDDYNARLHKTKKAWKEELVNTNA